MELVPISNNNNSAANCAKTQCCVCLEDFDATQNIPKVLHCGHSLCVNCIKRTIRTANSSRRNFLCPQCRVRNSCRDIQPNHFRTDLQFKTVLPNRGATALPTNFQLVDVLKPNECHRLKCHECKCAADESSLFVCKKCTLENHNYQITNNDRDASRFAICTRCVLFNHRNESHDVLGLFTILSEWEFNKNMLTVRTLHSTFDEQFSKLRSVLANAPIAIANADKKLMEMTEQMRRCKSSTQQSKIMKTYQSEINKTIYSLGNIQRFLEKNNSTFEQRAEFFKSSIIENEANCFPKPEPDDVNHPSPTIENHQTILVIVFLMVANILILLYNYAFQCFNTQARSPIDFKLMDLLESIDYNALRCQECNFVADDDSLFICLTCSFENRGDDIAMPSIDYSRFAICAKCISLNHPRRSHQSAKFFVILHEYQFNKNIVIVESIRTRLRRQLANVQALMACTPTVLIDADKVLMEIVAHMKACRSAAQQIRLPTNSTPNKFD
ncbi:unnamed protein product [Caenorhabditis bovis]|uniref:RING-type domain-containing protein n=1 Tax=Caenorhabditis bovis TaxID=2654633 RepID=A0A8S1F0L8_9PELO|nr:unnamed protein product [Caenorhabditis bovis]